METKLKALRKEAGAIMDKPKPKPKTPEKPKEEPKKEEAAKDAEAPADAADAAPEDITPDAGDADPKIEVCFLSHISHLVCSRTCTHARVCDVNNLCGIASLGPSVCLQKALAGTAV
jgi:hypothetical protein